MSRDPRKVDSLIADISGGKNLLDIRDGLTRGVSSVSKRYKALSKFGEWLSRTIITGEDKDLALFTLEFLLPYTNESLGKISTNRVPSQLAGLIKRDDVNVGNFIKEWDRISLNFFMRIEHEESVLLMEKISLLLESNSCNLNVKEHYYSLMSASIREFERRLGQTRKQRAGKDIEVAISSLLDLQQIQHNASPVHFKSELEADLTIPVKSGHIAISSKRSLRERWKQTVVSKRILEECGIVGFLHIICDVSDLTASKVDSLHEYGHKVFIQDSDFCLMTEDISNLPNIFPLSKLKSFILSMK